MTEQEVKQKMRLTLWQKFLVWAMKRMIRLCEKNGLVLCINNEYFSLGFINTRNMEGWLCGEENVHNHTYEVGDYIVDIHEPYIEDRYVWADFKED